MSDAYITPGEAADARREMLAALEVARIYDAVIDPANTVDVAALDHALAANLADGITGLAMITGLCGLVGYFADLIGREHGLTASQFLARINIGEAA